MNRGIARRTVFESDDDIRFFLSRLARTVRRGWLELHAFAILTTHFHLLVRSPQGRLSDAIGSAEHHYVRWFNRRRRRDGPLFRGRFVSRAVRDAAYWRTVLAYIDENPLQSRLARSPTGHPWSSAHHYARPRGPRWLRRDVVEAAVADALGASEFRPELYAQFALVRAPPDAAWRAERNLESRPPSRDELLDLAPQRVLAWMRRKARLADGSTPGAALVQPATLLRLLEPRLRHADRASSAASPGGGSRSDALTAGLLRWASGLSLAEIASQLRCSRGRANRLVDDHGRRVQFDEDYRGITSDVIRTAMEWTRQHAPRDQDLLERLGFSAADLAVVRKE